jgi:aquaporin Z
LACDWCCSSYCCYVISGGAFNPAVAISLYAAGKLPQADLLPYIIVQILGGLAAFYAYTKFVNKV